MRGVRFAAYGGPEMLELKDLPLPVPGRGQVRVRVAAAGVNPSDWRLRSGQFKRFVRIRLPFVPGSDVAGIIDAVGVGVTGWQRGDAVFAMLPTKEGGAYAEQVVVSTDTLAAAPVGRTLAEAAALPLAGLTALQALSRAELGVDDELLVYGAAGGVGSLAVQLARAAGARVTAVSSTSHLDLVRELGAQRVIDRTTTDIRTESVGYDRVLDAANGLSLREARRLLRPGGVAVTVNPAAGLLTPDWLAWTRGGRRLRSVLVKPDAADLRTLAHHVSDGRVRPVIARRFRLEDAAAAHRESEGMHVRGKLVLVVDPHLADTVVRNHRPCEQDGQRPGGDASRVPVEN